MDRGVIGRGVEWIHVAQYWNRWRAVVNVVMNLQVLAPRTYLSILLSKIKSFENVKLLNVLQSYFLNV
jgi:hypothetical protein